MARSPKANWWSGSIPSSPLDLIKQQVERFKKDFDVEPVVASEIEFYLFGVNDTPDIDTFWQAVESECKRHSIALYKHEAEKGHEQFEIALAPGDPAKVAHDTKRLKTIIIAAAAAGDMRADFAARPLPGEPGSGLHIHIHLNDAKGANCFYKDDDTISASLHHSIGGLLTWLPDSMPVFAPNAESYARFTDKSNAPMTVSWGANNRTVAVRLPDAPHDNKRIEHRVAGADADPAKVIAVILAAMHDGVTRHLDPGPQIYGDATLPMYNLPKFPASLEEAKERLKKSAVVKAYFSASDL